MVMKVYLLDFLPKRISYYDSLRGDGTLYLQNEVAYLKTQEDAIHATLPHLHPPFNIAEWTLHPNAGFDFPAQPNPTAMIAVFMSSW